MKTRDGIIYKVSSSEAKEKMKEKWKTRKQNGIQLRDESGRFTCTK